ncbi:MAG: hypothetical protein EZS28_017366 [Streblomastix strix]|uniref:Ataxin-10 domain-containing protein n=1 Tax=Streblomastix strix TaxID=222440 RepID=A0A5J4VWZ2_9EUKA|nr:MAG: hypothetical protein EZS28_017366 [Streblomastix strix]
MMHTPENEQHTDEDKADQLLPTQIDRQSLINIFIEYFNIGIKEGFTLSQVKVFCLILSCIYSITTNPSHIYIRNSQLEGDSQQRDIYIIGEELVREGIDIIIIEMLYHSVVFQPPQFGRRIVDVGNVQQPISYEQWRCKQKNIDDKEKYQLNIQSTTKIEIIDKYQYWPQIGFKRLNEQSSSSSLQPSSTTIPPLLEQGYRTLLLKTLGNLCYSTIEGPQHIRQINAFPLILTLTNYDDSNPFMREAAIWTMRNATLGNKENSDLVASMTSSGSIRTDLGIDEQSVDPEMESDIKDEKEVIQSK